MKTIQYTFLFIFFLSFGCKKNTHDSPNIKEGENVLNDNSHLVSSASIQSISENSIILKSENLNFTPKVNDIVILLSPVGDTLKAILKIQSISQSNNQISCKTEIAGLNDAFKKLNIDYAFDNSYETSTTYNSFTVSNNYELSVGSLSLNGNLFLNFPSVNIKYRKKEGSVLPDTVSVVASLNTEGSSLELAAASGKWESKSRTLLTLPTILVPVPVGFVVIEIPFSQRIMGSVLPASVSGRMDLKFYPVIRAKLGFSYENGDWKNLSGYRILAGTGEVDKDKFSPDLNASLTFLTFSYQIAPLESEKLYAYLEVPNTISAKIQSRKTPNYSIRYDLTVKAGIVAKFWTGLEVNPSVGAQIYGKTINEGNFIPIKGKWIYNGDRVRLTSCDGTEIFDGYGKPNSNIFLDFKTDSVVYFSRLKSHDHPEQGYLIDSSIYHYFYKGDYDSVSFSPYVQYLAGWAKIQNIGISTINFYWDNRSIGPDDCTYEQVWVNYKR